MKILVVSGFLGAGKTTFIKELISKTKKPLVILENEYGQTDLDSKDLSGASENDLNVMEFMEGCVCCSKKDSFANSLIAIQASLDPEYLVVEPTGVGKLGNILANVKKVEWEKISLLKPVVIVSPRSFFNDMKEYGDICKDQIKYASYIIFSKTENMDLEEISIVSKAVSEINPNAVIIDSPYRELDSMWFKNLLLSEDSGHVFFEEKKEEIIDQYTLKNASVKSPESLLVLLENIIYGRLGEIPRAKGIVKSGKLSFRFDVASGMYSVTEADSKEAGQCVFIGNKIEREEIDRFFELDFIDIMRKERVKELKISGENAANRHRKIKI